MNTSLRRRFEGLIGLVALALVLNACLPSTSATPRPHLPPPAAPPYAWSGGSGSVHSLLSLPPVPFEEDAAGPGEPVTYRARAGALTAQYGPAGVSYAVVGHDPATVDAEAVAACRPAPGLTREVCPNPPLSQRWRLHQDFVGGQVTQPLGAEPAEAVVSYLGGPESAQRSGLSTYHRLVYAQVWPGVDLAYERTGPAGLKGTYYLAPGAEASTIRLLWRGAEARIAEDGALLLGTPLGELRESAPVAWQQVDGVRRPVAARYEIVSQLAGDAASAETEVGFALGTYDPSLPLVIDPTLLYASYLGGSQDDSGTAIAVDGNGAIYVTGRTASTQTTFPVGNKFETPGPPGFDKTFNNLANDAYVIKLNPGGTSVVYATYLGGGGDDVANGIAIDASGAAYVVGTTVSTKDTFPDGNGLSGSGIPGFDRSFNGGLSDAYVVKLAPAGTSLVYATYLGGSGTDEIFAIALDASGAAYVGGRTSSTQTTFPNGTGLAGLNLLGFDQTYNGDPVDGFVVKLSPDGQSLGYATYLGGALTDVVGGIAVDASGAAYVLGYTDSKDDTFPNGLGLLAVSVPGVDQTYNGGTHDAFVVKLAPNGRTLDYATYLGGDADDQANRIVIDGTGAAYVIGATQSTQKTFPDGDPNKDDEINVPGFDVTHNGLYDGFAVKLAPSGAALLYATYLGGAQIDAVTGIAIDSTGAVYLSGYTESTETTFPHGGGLAGLGLPGFDQTFNGGQVDGFVAKLASDGQSLAYATYLGGNGVDYIFGIALTPGGIVYATGQTTSTEATFPDGDPNNDDKINVPGFDKTHNGVQDAYVVVVGPQPTNTPPPTATSVPTATSTPPPTATSVPTATSTPPPTATVVAASRCAPRPNVQVTSAPTGDGRLRVTLRAQTLPATPTNALSGLRVTSLANARVSIGGAVVAQGQAVPLAAGTQDSELVIERVTPGQAATVGLVAIDACGEWSTLVGGGPNAF